MKKTNIKLGFFTIVLHNFVMDMLHNNPNIVIGLIHWKTYPALGQMDSPIFYYMHNKYLGNQYMWFKMHRVTGPHKRVCSQMFFPRKIIQ